MLQLFQGSQRLSIHHAAGTPLVTTVAAATNPAAGSAALPKRRIQGPEKKRQQYSESYVNASLEQQSTALQRLTSWAQSELPRYMPPAERQWQPSDLLPDSASSDYIQQVAELREEAKNLPTDVQVVLAGLTVTAAMAPNQLSQWCGTRVLQDCSGADQQPWAVWRRSWAGCRNKHRQLLLSYCFLSGCFDMQAVERSMQETIGAGWDGGCQWPYQQLILGVMQARMLRVMHTNLANVASYHGALGLARIATAIAADEGRHEVAMVAAVSQLFKSDPEGAVQAFAHIVQEGITLPAVNMEDGWHVQGNAAAIPRVRRHLATDTISGKAGSVISCTSDDSATVAEAQQQRLFQGGTRTPSAAGVGASGGRLHQQCSQLYIDFMAIADAVGVWTVNDMATAVEQCCKVWEVTKLQTQHTPAVGSSCGTSGSSSGTARSVQLLLQHPVMLQRLAELQLEGKLKARRRDKVRSAAFSWVFKREVALV